MRFSQLRCKGIDKKTVGRKIQLNPTIIQLNPTKSNSAQSVRRFRPVFLRSDFAQVFVSAGEERHFCPLCGLAYYMLFISHCFLFGDITAIFVHCVSIPCRLFIFFVHLLHCCTNIHHTRPFRYSKKAKSGIFSIHDWFS